MEIFSGTVAIMCIIMSLICMLIGKKEEANWFGIFAIINMLNVILNELT